MNTPETVHLTSAMDQDDSRNPFLGLQLWMEDVSTRLLDLERPQKPGLKVKVENDEGEVSFISKLLQERKNIEQDVEITIANKTGTVTFDAHSSWNFGCWAKLCLAAGAIFWYRDEIRIIARGILAGANLAIERWDERHTQKGRELLKGQEAGAGAEVPAQCESHASVVANPSYTPAAVNCGIASSGSFCAPMPPPEGQERVGYVENRTEDSIGHPAYRKIIDFAQGMYGAQP